MTWAFASFALGMAAQWALSRYGVTKRQAARREFQMELRRPVDLEPSEWATFWDGR